MANELVDWFNTVDATYRSDLDRLNELNFARFDAKFEQRLALQDAKWEQRFTQLEVKWEQRFTQLELNWEQRFAQLEVSWERRFVRLEKSLGDLRTDMVKWMFAFWTGTLLALAGFLFAILRSRPGA